MGQVMSLIIRLLVSILFETVEFACLLDGDVNVKLAERPSAEHIATPILVLNYLRWASTRHSDEV